MYKYIRYVNILLFTVFRKVFGLVWYFVAVPFRGYARNVVYNYALENNVYIKRLLERPLTRTRIDWQIAPFHGSEGGYIKDNIITACEYYFVYWFIWGWLDDDSNQDTYAEGYNTTLINRERLTWLPEFIINSLKKTNDKSVLFGNTFDIGDKRAEHPAFSFWASCLWTVRNTAYNFKYVQWEENRPEMIFYHEIKGFRLGWIKDNGRTGVVNNIQNYRLVFGRF